jgi:hypothetical protein
VACADDARARIHAVGETFDERIRVRGDLEERIYDLDADITECYQDVEALSKEPL